MKTIESMLKNELILLKRIITSVEKRQKTAPDGQLRVAKKKNRIEYYYKRDGNTCVNGRYLRKSEEDLARRIAQRDYDTHLLKYAKRREKIIEGFLKDYKITELTSANERMSPYRKKLIAAAVVSDEEFIERWQNISYEKRMFSDNEKVIISERGERVRSKSEKIIADKLYKLGIPYRYEYPLLLDRDIKVHPDFTILKMPEREEVYLEHMGMMDDSGYVSQAVNKISTYEKNGIYIGVSLFLTYETSRRPLNTKALDEMLKALFCEE